MSTLVLYDSVFGNTEQVAKAVAEAVGGRALRVTDAEPDDVQGFDLLIFGSPTRAFNPMPSVKAFINSLPKGALNGLRVATFDTHFSDEMVQKGPGILKVAAKIFGNSAAKVLARQLTGKGAVMACDPQWFAVEGEQGPLAAGELERAAKWAKTLV